MAQSNAKVEYRSMASTTIELTWLSFLLCDLYIPLYHAPLLHCDNLSALHMTVNPVFHGRSKHIELDYHYVREQVALSSLETHFFFFPQPTCRYLHQTPFQASILRIEDQTWPLS